MSLCPWMTSLKPKTCSATTQSVIVDRSMSISIYMGMTRWTIWCSHVTATSPLQPFINVRISRATTMTITRYLEDESLKKGRGSVMYSPIDQPRADTLFMQIVIVWYCSGATRLWSPNYRDYSSLRSKSSHLYIPSV
jgi:hypothetical protein